MKTFTNSKSSLFYALHVYLQCVLVNGSNKVTEEASSAVLRAETKGHNFGLKNGGPKFLTLSLSGSMLMSSNG